MRFGLINHPNGWYTCHWAVRIDSRIPDKDRQQKWQNKSQTWHVHWISVRIKTATEWSDERVLGTGHSAIGPAFRKSIWRVASVCVRCILFGPWLAAIVVADPGLNGKNPWWSSHVTVNNIGQYWTKCLNVFECYLQQQGDSGTCQTPESWGVRCNLFIVCPELIMKERTYSLDLEHVYIHNIHISIYYTYIYVYLYIMWILYREIIYV